MNWGCTSLSNWSTVSRFWAAWFRWACAAWFPVRQGQRATLWYWSMLVPNLRCTGYRDHEDCLDYHTPWCVRFFISFFIFGISLILTSIFSILDIISKIIHFLLWLMGRSHSWPLVLTFPVTVTPGVNSFGWSEALENHHGPWMLANDLKRRLPGHLLPRLSGM